jgi:hypothetical protein
MTPAQLSYANAVEFKVNESGIVEFLRGMSQASVSRQIASILLRRDMGANLDVARVVAQKTLEKGFLAVTELYPGDPGSPMRNLAEFSCSGVLKLKWVDGAAQFDRIEMADTVNGAGRFRLPIDIWLDPGESVPSAESYKDILDDLLALAKRYSHIQSVNLIYVPDHSVNEGMRFLDDFHKAIPKSIMSVSPELWIKYEIFKTRIKDIGIVTVKVSIEDEGIDPMKGVMDKVMAMGIVPLLRMPLLPGFYRKGWFSFEVGKVLDSWADRKIFNYYRDRLAWLEE